ncbi:hypothetical protein CAPTEDRAFT_197137 [Capitella teleta]|uniref:Uncharacterized protein n=1 Tax=Capitella teleta TaxID=283909 RepID=R7TZG0_CAPTE|nr:hypothetical protein CAPTEDRAFT_197137 [Capitella teleta]|eukprot:ELT99318.1 hypothetical protein CAPTEDRAFT_197137 [Capitella teleta]
MERNRASLWLYKTSDHNQRWSGAYIPSLSMRQSTLLERDHHNNERRFRNERTIQMAAKPTNEATNKRWISRKSRNSQKAVAIQDEPTSIHHINDFNEPTRRIRERLQDERRRLSVRKLLAQKPQASILKPDRERQTREGTKLPQIRTKRNNPHASQNARFLDFKCSSDFETVFWCVTRE